MQTAWAGIAVYCDHNGQTLLKTDSKTKSSEHLGHHEHEHQANSTAAEVKESSQNSALDSDCGVCHIACCAAVLPAFYKLAKLETPNNLAIDYRLLNINDIIDPIERPVWQLIL